MSNLCRHIPTLLRHIAHHAIGPDAHLLRRIGRHIARHRLAHAVAAIALGCIGAGSIAVHVLRPAKARYEGPVQTVAEPAGVWVLGVALAGVALVRSAR